MGIYYPFLGGGRTCGQITRPLVYDESLSIAQQIARIFAMVAQLENDGIQTDEFDEFKKQLALTLDAMEERLREYADAGDAKERSALHDEVQRLEKLIADMTVGKVSVFDPTFGRDRNMDVALNRVYDFVRYFAVTAVDYDMLGMTAEQYEAKVIQARDYDVCGAMMLYDEWRA